MFSLECKVLHFLLFEIALFNFLINDWNLPQNETFRGLHTNGIVFIYNVNHAAVFIHQFLILSLIVLWSINMSLLKNGLSYHCGHLFYYTTWITRGHDIMIIINLVSSIWLSNFVMKPEPCSHSTPVISIAFCILHVETKCLIG